MSFMIPMIELMAKGEMIFNKTIMAQIQNRRELAGLVSRYLQHTGNMADYFYAIRQILRIPEYERILLYLPFSDLRYAPEWFRRVYLDAWYDLLNIQDARENFFEGDTFEVDARPGGELERVVKCAHLTPWLVEAGYIGYAELKDIVSLNQDNEVLLRSFANTWRLIRERGLLSESEIGVLEELTEQVTQRAKLNPLYVSSGRQKWLRERNEAPSQTRLLTPKAHLAGPFSPNAKSVAGELESIYNSLRPTEVALIGGSRLKGYGTETSDLDVFRLHELEANPVMTTGSPHATHVYFNTLWMSRKSVDDLREIMSECAEKYFESPERKVAIERLESDLLQYRLLHKGFQRYFGGYDSAAKDYEEMDGNCPFYDDSYRKIATELFMKYVFIPEA